MVSTARRTDRPLRRKRLGIQEDDGWTSAAWNMPGLDSMPAEVARAPFCTTPAVDPGPTTKGITYSHESQ